MKYLNPGCLGEYDFESIAYYARKRFIEGFDTMELLLQATSNKEREEIALVAMMDLDDSEITNLDLSCMHADNCQITHCRELIKKVIMDQRLEWAEAQ
jgi:hypothetical protein